MDNLRQRIIFYILFIIASTGFIIYDFLLKYYFFEKVNLNVTLNDFGEYIFKVFVGNNSDNQSIKSSVDFSSNFNHYKYKLIK